MSTARRATKRSSARGARTGRAGRRAAPAKSKRQAPAGPAEVLYRACKPGWAVVAEKASTAPDTRFVCPFCPRSHRVPGPVRGFRRVRRPQWLKLRRVYE